MLEFMLDLSEEVVTILFVICNFIFGIIYLVLIGSNNSENDILDECKRELEKRPEEEIEREITYQEYSENKRRLEENKRRCNLYIKKKED